MNNDYKSALDKINPAEEKTAEIKELFKSRNMNKRKFIKPVVAVAACMALAVGVGSLGNAWNKGNQGMSPMNSFSIEVNAQTLDYKNGVGTFDTRGIGGGMSEGEKGAVGFDKEFQVTCSGDNIKEITYSIEGGVFNISYDKSDNIIIDGEKVDHPLNTTWGGCEGANESAQYKSFTLDYNKQTAKKTYIAIANSSDNLPKAQFEKIKKLSRYMGTISKIKEIYDEFYKDMSITCTVTYNDGTTETKKIGVSAKICKVSEVIKDIPKEKDGDAIIAVYKLQK